MDGSIAPRTMLAMSFPIVIEMPRVLEPTTPDTLIAGDAPVMPSPPVRPQRIAG
jgi:hypothetical protein